MGWININDKTPDEGQMVLCIGSLLRMNCEVRNMFVAKFYTSMRGKNHEYNWSYPTIEGLNRLNNVEYWMLLPDQPERLSEKTSKDEAIV